ncbi:hypothetical protein ElyMa_005489300 [Elysia marginata]|uniref:FLYWCH-type domain-containing protein n=1 Tax=Elysia marginata TaxID=1093978 RepID=A0AAV4ET69_9GAST|nr:hypothetical protein ElyMa_005489300 [Elysia marginata]
MEITTTNRGKPCFILENYRFKCARVTKTTKEWRCTTDRCKARCTTDLDTTIVIHSSTCHNHSSMTAEDKEKHKIRQFCKRKATDDISARPSKIVCSELRSTESLDYTHVKGIKNAIHLQRLKLRPKLPKTRQETLECLHGLKEGRNKDSKRKTNGCESFHRHFGHQFLSPHPNIFDWLEKIKEEQTKTALKVKAAMKPRKQATNEEAESRKRQKIMNDYKSGELTHDSMERLSQWQEVAGLRHIVAPLRRRSLSHGPLGAFTGIIFFYRSESQPHSGADQCSGDAQWHHSRQNQPLSSATE